MAQIELVRNDTLPNFGGTVDFDLTGYTVELHIDFPTALIKTADPSTGNDYNFTFDTDDLSAPVGTYAFEIQFTNVAGQDITYKKDNNGKKLKLKLVDEIA